MPMDTEGFKTTRALHDLGAYRPELAGILSPLYDEVFVRRYIQEQFLDDSASYVARYQNLDYWRGLVAGALRHSPLSSWNGPLAILDLGSGGGNSVFPLLDLCASARIVATDMSIPLLRSLKDHRDRHYADRSCLVVQMNAEEIVFESGSFDLVVGAALLHHVLDPVRTLSEVARVLKPGGSAFFFEPFEGGNLVLAMLLRHMLHANEGKAAADRLAPDVAQFFASLCHDFAFRKGVDKTNPHYGEIDDKWFFTKAYLRNAAGAAGFRDLAVYPLHRLENMFSDQVATALRLGLGKDRNCLPPWATTCLQELDEHFSPEFRKELIIEGGIILGKGARFGFREVANGEGSTHADVIAIADAAPSGMRGAAPFPDIDDLHAEIARREALLVAMRQTAVWRLRTFLRHVFGLPD
jgi:ubiquinone/menaquinone biosynthesis C-methylase UbiE